MPTRTLLIAAIVVAALLCASLLSRSSGAIPGVFSIPADATRESPSCGSCHFGSGSRPRVTVTPTKLLLGPGENISITTSHKAGVTLSGGFASEITAGKFTAGPRTRTSSNGIFVTHTSPSNNWEYGYTAPDIPGLVELYTVVNSVNGNGNTFGDAYGFHGFEPANTVSTPVRLYVLPTVSWHDHVVENVVRVR